MASCVKLWQGQSNGELLTSQAVAEELRLDMVEAVNGANLPVHDAMRMQMAFVSDLYSQRDRLDEFVEAEKKLAGTPTLLKMPSGYIQLSPWVTISNKQMELMVKYMVELGLTPSSRSRMAGLPEGELSRDDPAWEFLGD